MRGKRYALKVEDGKVKEAHVEPDNTGSSGKSSFGDIGSVPAPRLTSLPSSVHGRAGAGLSTGHGASANLQLQCRLHGICITADRIRPVNWKLMQDTSLTLLPLLPFASLPHESELQSLQ
jgi:hypothetical protein